MPFGALDRPALGLSLLKAELAKAGFACDVRYLNFTFAELVGCEDYHWISSGLPYTAFAGDWTFTTALYGARPHSDARYIDEILRRTWQLDADDIARILQIRGLVPHFLDYCMETVAVEGVRGRRLHLDLRAEHRFAGARQANQGASPRYRHRVRRRQLGGRDGRWRCTARSSSSTTCAAARPMRAFRRCCGICAAERKRGAWTRIRFPVIVYRQHGRSRSPVRRRRSSIWTRVQFLISPIISRALERSSCTDRG